MNGKWGGVGACTPVNLGICPAPNTKWGICITVDYNLLLINILSGPSEFLRVVCVLRSLVSLVEGVAISVVRGKCQVGINHCLPSHPRMIHIIIEIFVFLNVRLTRWEYCILQQHVCTNVYKNALHKYMNNTQTPMMNQLWGGQRILNIQRLIR